MRQRTLVTWLAITLLFSGCTGSKESNRPSTAQQTFVIEASSLSTVEPADSEEESVMLMYEIQAESLGISVEEVRRRESLVPYINDLRRHLRENHPDIYGGTDEIQTPNHQLILYFTDTERGYEIVTNELSENPLLGQIEIVIEPVPISYEFLQNIQTSLTQAVNAHPNPVNIMYSARIDVETGTIVIVSPDPDGLAEYLQEADIDLQYLDIRYGNEPPISQSDN